MTRFPLSEISSVLVVNIDQQKLRELSVRGHNAFETAFLRMSRAADTFLEIEGDKLDRFAEAFGKELEEHVHEVVGHFTH